MTFAPIDSSLLFTRNDSSDPRLGDLGRLLPELDTADKLAATLEEAAKTSAQSKRFVLAGYPDDEGIKVNGGRPGAAHAPLSVRKPFYKMTPSLLNMKSGAPLPTIWDLGDLRAKGSLSERHETATRYARAALDNDAVWLSIGGGHDYGFPDTDAFASWCKANGKVRPLVLNFDAHLDVRPLDKGLSSGTPFYRLLEKHPDVDFAEIGIQAHCNSFKHLEWVLAKGARVVMQEEAEASGESWSSFVVKGLSDWITRRRPVFLSIDIDGFTSMAAPGCSQSWATGFTPNDFFELFDLLLRRLDVRGVGVYEVSPPLDQDDRTSKLAAQILHRTIFASSALGSGK